MPGREIDMVFESLSVSTWQALRPNHRMHLTGYIGFRPLRPEVMRAE